MADFVHRQAPRQFSLVGLIKRAVSGARIVHTNARSRSTPLACESISLHPITGMSYALAT